MVRIPQTKEEFDRMTFLTQSEVKKELVRENFFMMCKAVNPQTLQRFSPVLYASEMEELRLSKERHSRQDVAAELLTDIMYSSNRKPTWWEILESVLREGESWELYYAMNPWLDREDVNGGGAAGGGGGGDGRGGGGGRGGAGGSAPSPPMKPPYKNSLSQNGPEGQQVVREMEQRGLVLPLQRAGSEADGEVGGDMYDDEREGGTSATSAWVPTPRFPPDHTVEGQKFTAEPTSLSSCQPPTEESVQSSPVARTETSSRENLEKSIEDNIKQSHKVNPSDRTGIVEEKITNCRPASTPAVQDLSEDGRENASQKTAQESMPVQTDDPASLSQSDPAWEEIPQWLRSSQEEILYQLTAASQDPKTEVQQAAPSSPSEQSQTKINININSVEKFVLRQENTTGSADVRMAGSDAHEPPVPATEGTSVRTGHAEASEYNHIPARGEENHEVADPEGNLDSHHPDPVDSSAQETHPKQLDTGYNEDEECPSGLEGEEDVSDIIDLRENNVNATGHAGSLRNDNTLTTQSAFLMTAEGPQSGSVGGSTDSLPVDTSAAPMLEETDEVGNNHPADDDPTSPLPPPHDLGSQQPLSPSPPQPQPRGLMTHLSTAWTFVKDTVFGLK